ncbi:MAG: MBL fold metallo-hydrolase [Bacteroidota bacterium]|nr:MBL fold metallo-hydrolase [Bacteroidota bacterium]
MSRIRILPVGGAGEIGASCFHVDFDGTGIVLDAGMHPRKKGIESLPNFDLMQDLPLDAVLISHAHEDHIGSLPYLIQRFPYLRIVTTPQTRAIAELTLHNSVSILQEELAREEGYLSSTASLIDAGKERHPLKPYTHDEIDLLIQSIEYRAYEEQFTVSGYENRNNADVNASFWDAGHVLGSAGILLEHGRHTLFYTGDVRMRNQTLAHGAQIPRRHIDTLMLECTQGATEPSSFLEWEDEAQRFAQRANEIIEQGGSILIPVFALGKMQEMLATIWQLMEQGTLAKTDIYTGGIARKICTVYDRNRYVAPRMDKEFEFADVEQLDFFEIEQTQEFFRRPSIILATSGMMVEGTMSFRFAQQWLSEKRSAIFTVGYMDPDTPGYRIANAQQGNEISLTEFSERQKVRCAIEHFHFTAHSMRDGLISIVRRTTPDRVVLIHGDPEAIDWMGFALLKNFPETKVHAAEIGKAIEL